MLHRQGQGGVSGGREINGPERTETASFWGKRSFVAPIHLSLYNVHQVNTMSEAQYSETQFKKAAEIVQSLPKDGPIQPSQSDQLYVRTPIFFMRS